MCSRSTRSSKTKAINDPEGLRKRILHEEEMLARTGTLHPDLTQVIQTNNNNA